MISADLIKDEIKEMLLNVLINFGIPYPDIFILTIIIFVLIVVYIYS